jgi:hypothetical protein
MTASPNSATDTPAPADRGGAFDDAAFDALVAALGAWSGSLPEWPPARRVRAAWSRWNPGSTAPGENSRACSWWA